MQVAELSFDSFMMRMRTPVHNKEKAPEDAPGLFC